MRLPFNYNSMTKRKKLYLAAVFVFFAAFVFLFSQIKFREDISEMLPSDLKEEISLFQNSPLSNKVFVAVSGKDESAALKAAGLIVHSFSGNGGLGLSFSKMDEDFILSYYYRAPYIWNADFAEKTAPLLLPDAIKARMEENLKNLFSPAGVFFKDFILADPLGVIPVFAEELKSLNMNSSLDAKNGYIGSEDGKEILLIFDYPKNSLDSAQAGKINAFFNEIKKEFPEGSSAFLMGAARYTNENNEIIAKDIKRIFFVSVSLMLFLFVAFLRTKKALLIYLVPPVVMAVAAVTVFYVFGGISGITIGFGSVLMGLSVDYSAYMYFALKASKEDERYKAAGKMFKPVATSAVTSILAFSLLFFSPIPIFKQIALFTAAGLLAAFFIAMYVAPFIFECKEAPEKNFEMKVFFKPVTAVLIVILIFAGAAVSLKFIRFNASLDSVNTVSKQFEKDKTAFEKLTGNAYGNNAFLFVFGDTADEALQNNEIVSAKNPDILKLYKLYPSEKTKTANLLDWKAFWNGDGKADLVKKEIDSFSKAKGIKPETFTGFYEFLKTGTPPAEPENSLYELFNPVIKHGAGFAFVNIVPENAQINTQENIKTLLVSNEGLQHKIASSIRESLLLMMFLLAIGTFLVLIFWLKKVQFVLLALLAPVCGICVFAIALAVFSVELNLFGLFAVPLLIGLGIDYGIFIIYQQKGEAKLHPTRAVLVAAFSTIIGFGSLMAAQHKVLFIIGFMVFTGILTAILISIFIIPSLLKGSKKSLLLLLVFMLPFAGCATGGIKYNVKEPEPAEVTDIANAKTLMFYGSYKNDLQFRAISRMEDDGFRIVIMSDLGVKLQDMKVKKDLDTDVYFNIAYMPKEIVEDFAAFFSQYYFDAVKKNIKQEGSTLYYYDNDGKLVLWVTQK